MSLHKPLDALGVGVEVPPVHALGLRCPAVALALEKALQRPFHARAEAPAVDGRCDALVNDWRAYGGCF